jgi:hypothetical protein
MREWLFDVLASPLPLESKLRCQWALDEIGLLSLNAFHSLATMLPDAAFRDRKITSSQAME